MYSNFFVFRIATLYWILRAKKFDGQDIKYALGWVIKNPFKLKIQMFLNYR